MATDRTATGLSYVPAPKTKLPGHEESYNPPKEYLPSEVSATPLPPKPDPCLLQGAAPISRWLVVRGTVCGALGTESF